MARRGRRGSWAAAGSRGVRRLQAPRCRNVGGRAALPAAGLRRVTSLLEPSWPCFSLSPTPSEDNFLPNPRHICWSYVNWLPTCCKQVAWHAGSKLPEGRFEAADWPRRPLVTDLPPSFASGRARSGITARSGEIRSRRIPADGTNRGRLFDAADALFSAGARADLRTTCVLRAN